MRESDRLIERGMAATASSRVDLEGTFPFVAEYGKGPFFWDTDGNRYLDFTASSGAILLGYRQTEVDEAVIDLIRNRGTIFPTTLSEQQVALAERLINIFPCAERALFFRTGSCATTAAVRLARVFTGRDVVLTSGYHGWHDWQLQIFPRFRFQDSRHIDFRYNLNLLENLLSRHRGNVACIIITPEPTFFDKQYFVELQAIAHEQNVLLIFDEIVSAFRYGIGGVQSMYEVVPDMSTIGKGLANGYGLTAVIGRRDVLNARSHTHLVGTYQHELTPFAAAIATLEIYLRDRVWERLEAIGGRLLQGLSDLLCGECSPNFVGRYPGLFHIIFEHEPLAQRFYSEMLKRGVVMHPFDCQMITAAHSESDIDQAISAAKDALQTVGYALPTRGDAVGNASLSREALDFRTLHEFGGTVRYRDPIDQVPVTWDQADR